MAVPTEDDEKRTAKRSSLPAQTAGAYWQQNNDECEDTTLRLINNEDYPAASNDTCPCPASQQNGRECRSRIARSKSRSRWIILASLILISIAWGSGSVRLFKQTRQRAYALLTPYAYSTRTAPCASKKYSQTSKYVKIRMRCLAVRLGHSKSCEC
jgi:hypothetical protein